MAKQSIYINKMDGGLNNKDSPYYAKPNYVKTAYNVDFDDLGSIKTRYGFTYYLNPIAASYITYTPITLLHVHGSAAAAGELLVAKDSSLGVLSSISAYTTLTEGSGIVLQYTPIVAINFMGYSFFSDGTNAYKWNRVNGMTKWGGLSSAPTGISNVTVGATAASTLSYPENNSVLYYRTAWETHTGMVTGYSPSYSYTFVLTAYSGNKYAKIALSSSVKPASSAAKYLNVYRNDDLALQVAASQVSAASFVVENFLTIGDRDPLKIDNTQPVLKCFVEHLGIIFGATDNSTVLYYSAVNSPEEFEEENIIYIGREDGYSIRSVTVFNGNIVIGKDDGYGNGGMYVLYTPSADPDSWSLSKLNVPHGTAGTRSIAKFANKLAYVNKNGIFTISELQVGYDISEEISFTISSDVKNFISAKLQNAIIFDYNKRLWCFVCDDNTRNANSTVYIYDYTRGNDYTTSGAWSKYRISGDQSIIKSGVYTWYSGDITCVTNYNGELVLGNYIGVVSKYSESVYTDKLIETTDVEVSSYFDTMYINGKPEHADNVKLWRELVVSIEFFNGNNTYLTYYDDTGKINKTVKIIDYVNKSTIAVYGLPQSVYDVSVYDSGYGDTVTGIKIPLMNCVSRGIFVKIHSVVNTGAFKVHTIRANYAIRGER